MAFPTIRRFILTGAMWGSLLLPTPASGQSDPSRTFSGCYDIGIGPWEGMAGEQLDSIYHAPPSRIILDSIPPLWPRFEGERLIRVAPNALPSVHEITTWTLSNDTLILGFSTGFAGFVARLPLTGKGLTGRAYAFTDVEPSPPHSADLQLVRVDCDTPPSPSTGDQRFVFRSLELLNGTELSLAQELAYDPSWRRKEGKVSGWIDGVGTRRFPTAREIRVSPTRQGVISLFVIKLDSGTPFDALVSRLQEELGPPVSRSVRNGSDIESEFVHWRNRTTTLSLNRSRLSGGEWTISVTLSDPRLGR